MTETESRILAKDIVEGKVFGSWMLSDKDLRLLPIIFMPLAAGAATQLPDDVSCLYEYRDRAAQQGINGCPVFSSMKFLTHTEREKLVDHIEEYTKIRDAYLGESR